MKIAVAGTGYVGLSISVLLAQHNEVWAVDILPEKVALLAARKSPIADKEIEKYLAEKELDLHPTTDAAAAYTGADIIVVSTPTNYDPKKNYFDTSSCADASRAVCAGGDHRHQIHGARRVYCVGTEKIPQPAYPFQPGVFAGGPCAVR